MMIRIGAWICVAVVGIAIWFLPKLNVLKNTIDTERQRDFWESAIKAVLYFVIAVLATVVYEIDKEYYLNGFIIVVSSFEAISNLRNAYKIWKN